MPDCTARAIVALDRIQRAQGRAASRACATAHPRGPRKSCSGRRGSPVFGHDFNLIAEHLFRTDPKAPLIDSHDVRQALRVNVPPPQSYHLRLSDRISVFCKDFKTNAH